MKANPVLADRLMSEARGVAVNPYSKLSWNVTAAAQIERADPDLARWMKLGRVHSDQQEQAEVDETRRAASQAQFRAASGRAA